MIQRTGLLSRKYLLDLFASLVLLLSAGRVHAKAAPDESEPVKEPAGLVRKPSKAVEREPIRTEPSTPPVTTSPVEKPARKGAGGSKTVATQQSLTDVGGVDKLVVQQQLISRPSWTRLWSVPVGSTEDNGAIGLGQIALRGPMVVVASRGIPGQSDDQDGVYVVNGARDLPDGERIVRKLTLTRRNESEAPDSPDESTSSAPGSTDAVGVALDGDFAVFGTYGGAVGKVRLDGVVAWRSSGFSAGTRPGLPALIDVNGDGQRDAVLPVIPSTACSWPVQKCGPEWATLAIALDGRDGRELWRIPRSQVGADCTSLVMGLEARHQLLTAGCASFDGQRAESRTLAAFDLAGRSMALREDIDATRDLMMVVEGLAKPASAFYGLEVDSTRLDVVDMATQATVQATDLQGRVQSLPSLGDVNRDGQWDVVVVAGGELQAWSTGAEGRALQTLWRTDAAASGGSTFFDRPTDYGFRVEPRDGSRWLMPPRDPTDDANCTRLDHAWPIDIQRDPAAAENASKTSDPAVVAELRCRHVYGINEGHLVIRKGSDWRRVPGAPWPLVALGCWGSNVLLERADGVEWLMETSLPWELHALAVVGVVFAAALIIAWLLTGKRGTGGTERELPKLVRRAIIDDSPRTSRQEAHPDQQRLLQGLLSVIDNPDTRPPVSIALYGDWGSGKSSLMQMLRSDLVARGRYIDVWFNAWRFQREKELAPALLQSIVDEVGKRTDWVTRLAVLWHRLRNASGRQVATFMLLLAAIALLFVISVRATSATADRAAVGGAVGTLVSVVAFFAGAANRVLLPLFKVFELEPANLLSSMDSKRRIRFVGAFADDFGRVCKRLPRDTRLIVFIDDLDRCPPDRVVNVLETLSMLADTGSAFFVLAIDPVSVRRAIELTYTRLLTIERKESPKQAATFASRYLEKMITLGVNVPNLAAGEIHPERDQPPTSVDATRELAHTWDWFKERVAPGAPVTVAILAVALACIWASTNVSAFDTLLDRGVELVFASAEPAVPGAATGSQTNPPTEQRAPLDAAAKDGAVHEEHQKTRYEGNGWLPPDLPDAEQATPRPAPKVVERIWDQTPARGRLLSEVVIFSLYALGALCLITLVAIFHAEATRRKKAGNAPPMVKDSPEFLSALKACRARLAPNPRAVVRFTNLCRFLHPVVEANPEAKETWQAGFFEGLFGRWSGEATGPLPAWLEAELDRWIPKPGQQDARDTDRPMPLKTPVPDSDPSAMPSIDPANGSGRRPFDA